MVETLSMRSGIDTLTVIVLVVFVELCIVVFIGACCDGDFNTASQVLDSALLTPADITNFVTLPHSSDSYSLLYRLLGGYTLSH